MKDEWWQIAINQRKVISVLQRSEIWTHGDGQLGQNILCAQLHKIVFSVFNENMCERKTASANIKHVTWNRMLKCNTISHEKDFKISYLQSRPRSHHTRVCVFVNIFWLELFNKSRLQSETLLYISGLENRDEQQWGLVALAMRQPSSRKLWY
jgi:hypothetical protein